ncbi:hypothetical protein L596_004830 [Steinernema carpocapsae]|uniref:Uncharacterized protein n=1 Tax=Steinernema carpocapsae TaxID=34508 RepID=A0A4U8UY33_STECR|nr:hypothetical protein L596_004830 [Steinernema carpocapsae]
MRLNLLLSPGHATDRLGLSVRPRVTVTWFDENVPATPHGFMEGSATSENDAGPTILPASSPLEHPCTYNPATAGQARRQTSRRLPTRRDSTARSFTVFRK